MLLTFSLVVSVRRESNAPKQRTGRLLSKKKQNIEEKEKLAEGSKRKSTMEVDEWVGGYCPDVL